MQIYWLLRGKSESVEVYSIEVLRGQLMIGVVLYWHFESDRASIYSYVTYILLDKHNCRNYSCCKSGRDSADAADR